MQKIILRLSELCVGNQGVIISTGHMQNKLERLGILSGAVIECLFHGPFEDPGAYYVCGTVIAIRQSDAKDIFIKGVTDID